MARRAVIQPPSQSQIDLASEIMQRQEWTHYTFTQEQLAQYISIFADAGGINVVNGNGGATHMPTRNVTLPVGAFNAQDIAAHEATHIAESGVATARMLRSAAERMIFNAIEDARMERKTFHGRPGLRRLYQENRIDHAMPLILGESWLLQALKGMYLIAADYAFPRSKFKPKARKILTEFEKVGLHTDIRRAKTDEDLLPLVPRILAMFNESLDLPQQSSSVEYSDEPDADDDGDQDGVSLDQPSGGPVDQQQGGTQQQNEQSDPNAPLPEHTNTPGEECPACEEIDRREREAKKQSAAAQRVAESASQPYDGSTTTRDARTYNVDEERHLSEAASKFDDNADETSGGSYQQQRVNGKDTAIGGPSVNRLIQQANRLNRDLDRVDRQSLWAASLAKVSKPVAQTQSTRDKSASKAVDHAAPKHIKDYADVGKVDYEPITLDLKSLFSSDASGAVGYFGRRMNLRDGTKPVHEQSAALALEAGRQLHSTANFLARQMTVILQSEDHKGIADRQRMGRIDSTRAYQMASGRFDVYKNPPNPGQTRPLIVLTTDMSGSMGSGMAFSPTVNTAAPAFHAMTATILLGKSLRSLGIPFESHGFSSSSLYMFKKFEHPFNDDVIAATANVYAMGGGGTPAAESLAFAWARALTRPEDRKIVIQVTDGGVPSNAAEIAKAIRKDGGLVIGIGIGTDMASMKDTFDYAVTVRQASELPGQMSRLLKKLAAAGEFSRPATKQRAA